MDLLKNMLNNTIPYTQLWLSLFSSIVFFSRRREPKLLLKLKYSI